MTTRSNSWRQTALTSELRPLTPLGLFIEQALAPDSACRWR